MLLDPSDQKWHETVVRPPAGLPKKTKVLVPLPDYRQGVFAVCSTAGEEQPFPADVNVVFAIALTGAHLMQGLETVYVSAKRMRLVISVNGPPVCTLLCG